MAEAFSPGLALHGGQGGCVDWLHWPGMVLLSAPTAEEHHVDSSTAVGLRVAEGALGPHVALHFPRMARLPSGRMWQYR